MPSPLSRKELEKLRRKRARLGEERELSRLMKQIGFTREEREKVQSLWKEGKKSEAIKVFNSFRSVHRKEYMPQRKSDAAFMLFKRGLNAEQVKGLMPKTDPKMIDAWYRRWKEMRKY
jgi:hypothetical protein